MSPATRAKALGLAVVGLVVLAGALPSVLAVAAPSSSRSGPPPTPVAQAGGGTSPSPFPQVLRTPAPSAAPPMVLGASAILADLDSGQVLFAKDPDAERPIASLTKVMTALLVLRRSSPTDVVTVSANAAGDGRSPGISELGLHEGERISVGDLLYALLLQSANDAAVALAEHVAGSVDAFVAMMNRKAGALGLRHTHFTSPNGLSDTGYSSARDLFTLTREAYGVPGFRSITSTEFHTIPGFEDGPPRVVQNRNALLWLYPGATGAKTGFTSAAGFCVIATAERDGLRLGAVVLGEPGEPFSDAAAMLNYGFTAFERRDLLARGTPEGTIDIGGRRVPVQAGREVADALVPANRKLTSTVVALDGVRFPPGVGERVGTIVFSAGGLEPLRAPLVVSAVPPPPPPADAGPWYRRAVSSIAHAVGSILDALFG